MSDHGKYADGAVRSDTVVEAVSVDRSIGQLVAVATAEMSALVHDEIALAKAELRQDVKRVRSAAARSPSPGVFALFSLPVLSFAAAYGIHNLGLGLAWSFLIVGRGIPAARRAARRARRHEVQEGQAAGEGHRVRQGDGGRSAERQAASPRRP